MSAARPQWLTRKQAAQRMSRGVSTVYRWVQLGLIDLDRSGKASEVEWARVDREQRESVGRPTSTPKRGKSGNAI